MKLAALMPHKFSFGNYCSETPKFLKQIADVVIVYYDNTPPPKKLPDSNEEFVFVSNYQPWNSYGNQLTLLARAAAHGCEWVFNTDDDWTFPKVTRELINDQITKAIEQGCVGVSYKLREMWSCSHYRSDGIWGLKRKLVLQRNPLTQMCVQWSAQHLQPLHAVPLQAGRVMEADSECLHWGMSTKAKRESRMLKHQRLDPENKYQSFGYQYLTDETTMELTPI